MLDLRDLPKIAKRPQDFSFPAQELLALGMKLARELRTPVLPQDMTHEFARGNEPALFRGALHLGGDLFREGYVHDRSHTVIQSICIVLQLSRRSKLYSEHRGYDTVGNVPLMPKKRSMEAGGVHTLGQKPNKKDERVADQKEGIEIIQKMAAEWALSPSDTAALLGCHLEAHEALPALIEKLNGIDSQDISDRIDFVFDVKSALDAISGGDTEVQRRWLSAKQKHLGNKSPLELFRSGHQHELVRVMELLRRITGSPE